MNVRCGVCHDVVLATEFIEHLLTHDKKELVQLLMAVLIQLEAFKRMVI